VHASLLRDIPLRSGIAQSLFATFIKNKNFRYCSFTSINRCPVSLADANWMRYGPWLKCGEQPTQQREIHR
jgi:hypothetical protein